MWAFKVACSGIFPGPPTQPWGVSNDRWYTIFLITPHLLQISLMSAQRYIQSTLRSITLSEDTNASEAPQLMDRTLHLSPQRVAVHPRSATRVPSIANNVCTSSISSFVGFDFFTTGRPGQAVVWEACIGHKRKYSILKSTELVEYIEVTEKGTEILAESIDRPDSYYKLTWKSKGGVPKLKNWTAATHSAGVLFQDVRWNVESIELKLNWHGDYNIWIDQSHGNVICEGCKHKWWECKRQIPKM